MLFVCDYFICVFPYPSGSLGTVGVELYATQEEAQAHCDAVKKYGSNQFVMNLRDYLQASKAKMHN